MGAGGGGVEEEIKMGRESDRERKSVCVCVRTCVLGIDKLLVKGLNIYKCYTFY